VSKSRISSKFFLVSPGRIRKLAKPASRLVEEMRADALEMTVFNVGAGEAIILRRRNRAILVDGGAVVKRKNVELGKALKKYIEAERLKLRGIVASHPHVDHLNALSTLLTEGGPQILADGATYFDNGESMGLWLSETLKGTLKRLRGVLKVVHVGTAGTQLTLSQDVKINMFTDGSWRPKPVYKSIFMSLAFRETRFLLTGDAYVKYEKGLLNSFNARHLHTDVLKITHHGSEHGTGEDFVNWCTPRISVASTHDDPGHRLEQVVLDKLNPLGQVYDTLNTGGDIVVRTDGVWRTMVRRAGILYEVQTVKPGRLTHHG
jgi:competence protein ComEC